MDAIESYCSVFNDDPLSTNFGLLFAAGLKLQEAFNATLRSIEGGDLPAFSADQETCIRTLLSIHYPYISASTVGSDLLSLSERYNRTPAEERRFKQELAEFGAELRANEDIYDVSVSEVVLDSAEYPRADGTSEKRYVSAIRVARNISILTAAGAIGGVLVSAAMPIPFVGLPLSGAIALVAAKSLDKTSALDELSSSASEFLDRLSILEKTRLEKFTKFFVEQRVRIGNLVGQENRDRWFNGVAAWFRDDVGMHLADSKPIVRVPKSKTRNKPGDVPLPDIDSFQSWLVAIISEEGYCGKYLSYTALQAMITSVWGLSPNAFSVQAFARARLLSMLRALSTVRVYGSGRFTLLTTEKSSLRLDEDAIGAVKSVQNRIYDYMRRNNSEPLRLNSVANILSKSGSHSAALAVAVKGLPEIFESDRRFFLKEVVDSKRRSGRSNTLYLMLSETVRSS